MKDRTFTPAAAAADVLKLMRSGRLNRVLAVGTGALLSPTSSLQGESVPGIAHAAAFEMIKA